MARISEISVEEVEHLFTKARQELHEFRQVKDETDQRYWNVHHNDALEVLNSVESRILRQMNYYPEQEITP